MLVPPPGLQRAALPRDGASHSGLSLKGVPLTTGQPPDPKPEAPQDPPVQHSNLCAERPGAIQPPPRRPAQGTGLRIGSSATAEEGEPCPHTRTPTSPGAPPAPNQRPARASPSPVFLVGAPLTVPALGPTQSCLRVRGAPRGVLPFPRCSRTCFLTRPLATFSVVELRKAFWDEQPLKEEKRRGQGQG